MKKEHDIIQIENVFYSEPENSEKRLFLCVILQALLDVSKNTITSNDKVNKAKAEAWFFTKVGVTCDNFEEVCDMAGVQPEKARSFAYKVIYADNKKYLRNRIRSVLRGDNDREEKRLDI